MNSAVNKQKRPKVLPLREITLNSRPLVKRTIQFSCDGDLAVAADDSVHVFVPEFPDLSQRREKIKARADGYRFRKDEISDDEEDDENGGPGGYNRHSLRAQYSEGSKHMPVSFPPIDPRVNRELFIIQELPFPYESAADADARSPGSASEGSVDSDAYSSEDEDGEGAGLGSNRPFGAGYGPITGVGSSMNHVVCIGWSPSGLGVNRRPILAILTGSGTLGMYGDGSKSANILPRANEGMLQRRELNSWIFLWGVGERLVVPGQQTEVSEYVRGFAWANEIAPGQALLATVNDVKEVAIISVQLVSGADKGKSMEDMAFRIEGSENTGWMVREVLRFKAEGPHDAVEPTDLDWIPHGTSYGLRWGPWLETGNARTCVLSFVDHNYVGFRKVTIRDSWIRGEMPSVEVEPQDTYGICLHLSVDAFVEFEDMIWTHGQFSSCRGLIATGFELKQFDVALSEGATGRLEKHTTLDCGTLYRKDTGQLSGNPIVDLVVHPPDPTRPTPTPLYTLIRMSATTTTKDWYQTNVPAPSGPAEDPRPQWVRTIAQKLEVQVPVDLHLTHGYDDDESGSDASAAESEDEESDLDIGGNLDSYVDEDANGDDDAAALEVPEIHPHRVRLHGLTLSPGGGVAAVLASNHSTQHPERGGWHTVRSSVLFGYQPRRQRQPPQHARSPQPDHGVPIAPEFMAIAGNNTSTGASTRYARLTTEAKLFESLYGGGPQVPGVHYPASTDTTNSNEIRNLFAPALASQTCDLCGHPMNIRKAALCGCVNGHFFGTCATSGLAVQTPGATRSCGACGLRTMRAEVLVAKMPDESKEEVRRLVGDGLCGACGGKFLS